MGSLMGSLRSMGASTIGPLLAVCGYPRRESQAVRRFQDSRNLDFRRRHESKVVLCRCPEGGGRRLVRPKAGPAAKQIYTPDEMQMLLDTAWAYALPGAIPMAATALGSLRAEELCCQDPDESTDLRIAWEDINWKEKFIWVPEAVDKNGEGRRAGLPKNLLEMLRPRRGKGPLYPGSRLDLAYQEIAKKAGIKWKHNALRHSCLTYRMLLARNATDVATMAGNSVAIIEARYRNKRATKAEASKWFKLKPRVAWGSALRSKSK